MFGKKCALEIAVDGDACEAGGTLTGFVGVEVDADCTCNGLTLTLQWRTHGSGHSDQGPKHAVELFRGLWRSGDRQVHPFEIPIPPGPLTFHGQHVNVDWYLTARADIPWGFDPKAEREVIVRRPREPIAVDAGPVPFVELPSDFGGGWIQFLGASFFVAISVVFHLVLIPMMLLGHEPVLLVVMDGAAWIFTLLGLAMMRKAWRVRRAEQRLGPIALDVPRAARAGDRLEVAVGFTPAQGIEVEDITVVLHGTERAISGSGTRKRTHTHAFETVEQRLSGARPIPGGASTRLTTDLRLPPDAAADFSSANNTVRWDVTARIRLKGFPEITRGRRVSVS